MQGIIYCHTNKINNKKYIGQTISTIALRSKKGFGYTLDGNQPTHTKFANAINKYGWDNFEHEILKTVEANTKEELIEKLNELEIFYINLFDTFKNGYNCDLGGKNKNCSDKTKKKLSQAHKGKKLSEKTKQKLSESHKGRFTINNGIQVKHVFIEDYLNYINEGWLDGALPCTEEKKQKLHNANINKKLSFETREKMSKGHLGKKSWINGLHHTEETKRKISQANKGKAPYKMTDEIKEKIRNTLKLKYAATKK